MEAGQTPNQADSEQEPVLTQAEQEVADYFDNLGASSNLVRIYKLVNGESQYCGSAEPSIVSLEYILATYRGGKYRLQACYNGKIIAGGTKTVTVYEPPFDPTKATLNARVESNGSSEIGLLREQISRQQELIMQMIANQNGRDTKDFSEMMRLALDMRPAAPDFTAMLPSVIDIFGKAMEMGKDSNPSGDTKLEWFKFISGSLDKMLPVLQGMFMPKHNTAPGMAAVPGSNIPLKIPDQAEQLAQLGRAAIAEMKPYALKQSDPELIAEWILENIDKDPRYKNMAIALINQKFESLLVLDPEIAQEPLKSWFRQVYDSLKEGTGQNESPSDAEGKAGSASDTSGNETPDN